MGKVCPYPDAIRWPMPLSNSLPVQAFLDDFFQQRQGDQESESHAHDGYAPGINPAVERGARNGPAGTPAEEAPGMRGREQWQSRRGAFAILPHGGWTEGSCDIQFHGDKIPPTKFPKKHSAGEIPAALYPGSPQLLMLRTTAFMPRANPLPEWMGIEIRRFPLLARRGWGWQL